MYGYDVAVQPVGYLGFPQNGYGPPPNTTKKIQNYQFKLNEVLGKGNFSKVYRGINELNNQPVAIKVVEMSSIKTPALLDLLYSEIEIVKTLRHPNILRCYQVFTSANNCYIITELCDGDLETRIRNKGPMNETQASKTIYETFQGLKYLAEQSIVHRDFKIANILFNKGVAKIADFGFAKRTRDKWKDINIGSPIYMSPEGLIDNIYGPKTDIWAFGIFMYEILHGDTPLGFCQNEQELKMHIRNPIRPASIKAHVSHQLKDLILRCLDVDERRRVSVNEIQNMPYMRRLSKQFSYGAPQEPMIYFPPQQQLMPMQIQMAPMAGMSQQQMQIMQPNPNMVIIDPEPMTPARMQEITSANRMKSLQQMAAQGYIMQPESINILQQRPVSPSPRVNPMTQIMQDPMSQRKNQYLQAQQQQQQQNKDRQGISLERPVSRHTNLEISETSNKQVRPVSSRGANFPTSKKQSFETERATTASDSFKVVSKTCVLSFQECVNLLHYCRLVYKTAMQLTRTEKVLTSHPREYMTNWLFDIFRQIESIIPGQIRFEGQKAAIREKKLQEVITEYHKKYFKDLQAPPYERTSITGVQQLISTLLRTIDQALQAEDIQERRDLIVAAHYLMYIYETNTTLERCVQNGEYSTFLKRCNIESFLSYKKENYDDASYRGLRVKLDKL